MKFNIIIILILIITINPIQAQEGYRWRKYTGRWYVSKSKLVQTRPYNTEWGYYEFINYNSIISYNSLDDLANFEFKIKINLAQKKKEKVILLPFAATSPKGYFFYDFYAFKLCGDDNGIHSTSLIRSRWKDKTKSFRTKYNYVIDELTSEPLKLSYDTMHTVKITMSPERLRLFVNGKKVISHRVKNESYDGHIGFSVRNAFLAVDDVVVRDRAGKVVLEDNFDSSSIYVRTVKGRIKRGK